FENITLEGRHRVAPVVTFDNLNSTFENISVVNASVKGSGVYVSTFIGRKYGGSIKNVYVQGTLECTTTENGGIIGAFQKGGTIMNTISNVSVIKASNTDGQNRQLNGGFIGNIYNDGSSAPNIKNSISIGSMTGYTDNNGEEKNPYKFTGASEQVIIASLVNCYEYTIAAGMSSITGNTGSNLKGATSANIHDVNFYRETLAFDDKVWNFDSVVSNGYPTLK
ncbi:MAG: hypothetical protein HFH47_00910, partial [Bacilli bacterium]|nr:hypothetical protein [Bacilli bacterium]